MAFLVGTFVIFIVNERAVKAKHAQFVSGVGVTNFWVSTFIWDAISFIVPSVLIVIVVEAFQVTGYSSDSNAGSVIFSFLLNPPTTKPRDFKVQFSTFPAPN
jgi:ATP-binding cassette subfamily A (ABC1) protein 3